MSTEMIRGTEPERRGAASGATGRDGIDLMGWAPVRSLARAAWFPRVAQWPLLLVYASLIVMAWGAFTPAGVNDKLYAKSNLATLVIWGLWWPLMIWGAVWLGRVWCMVCPLEMVNDWGERLARRAGWPARSLPRWFAGGGLSLVMYALVMLLVPAVSLHRVPAYTAWYLTAMLAGAAVAGAWYRDRAYCRGFCPVGLLLGTFGRGGVIAVRPDTGTAGEGAPDARACPSLLNPSRLADNADCLACTQCFKQAAPGSLRLLVRRPFAASDARKPLATWPVTGFVMIVSGFVVSELCSEWAAAKAIYLTVPQWLTTQLGWKAAAGWIEGVWTLGVVPAILWLGLGALLRLAGEKAPWPQLWQRLALPVAVIVAAGHMSKGLAKFVSWTLFLPGASRDPAGVDTAHAITRKTMPAPPSLISLNLVSWIGLALVAVALFYAVREYRLARRGDPGAARGLLPLGVLAAGFGAIIAGWR